MKNYFCIYICRWGDTSKVQEYNVTTAYRIALETWAKWLETKINPVKQRVFFTSMSPTHLWYVLVLRFRVFSVSLDRVFSVLVSSVRPQSHLSKPINSVQFSVNVGFIFFLKLTYFSCFG